MSEPPKSVSARGGDQGEVPRFAGPRALVLLVSIITVGLVAGAAGAWLDASAFISAWLPVAFWLLDLSLGALVVRWLFDAGGGGWGEHTLPLMRLCASALPLGLVAALLVLWAARQQLPWLAEPTFIPAAFVSNHAAALRMVLYAIAWGALAWASGVWRDGDEHRRPRLGAVALIVHLPIATLLAIDSFASLQPEWYSTALGPRYISSQAVAGFAVVTLAQCLSPYSISEQSLRDLGTLLFASIIFWIYVAFMQFLIIWIGDLPREITWYLDRSSVGWVVVLCTALLLKLAIPGALLMSRRLKASARWLGSIAVIVLIGHLLDLVWQMSPAMSSGSWVRAALILSALAGLGGCWALIVLHRWGAASHLHVSARSAP